MTTRLPFDLGYWWGLVGQQLRDFDVAAVHTVSDSISGFYAFPARLVAPMNLVTVAAATSLFPRVARGGLTKKHLRLALTFGLVPVALIAAVMALAAPLLPVILGEAYDGSVDVMRVTCITAVLSGAGTLLSFMVQAPLDGGRPGRRLPHARLRRPPDRRRRGRRQPGRRRPGRGVRRRRQRAAGR